MLWCFAMWFFSDSDTLCPNPTYSLLHPAKLGMLGLGFCPRPCLLKRPNTESWKDRSADKDIMNLTLRMCILAQGIKDNLGHWLQSHFIELDKGGTS